MKETKEATNDKHTHSNTPRNATHRRTIFCPPRSRRTRRPKRSRPRHTQKTHNIKHRTALVHRWVLKPTDRPAHQINNSNKRKLTNIKTQISPGEERGNEIPHGDLPYWGDPGHKKLPSLKEPDDEKQNEDWEGEK